MSIEKVKEYFDKYGIKDRVLEFTVSSATVTLAAQALGCEEARIAKTLSFEIGEKTILVVTAGDMKIDNQKYNVYHNININTEITEYSIKHIKKCIIKY